MLKFDIRRVKARVEVMGRVRYRFRVSVKF